MMYIKPCVIFTQCCPLQTTTHSADTMVGSKLLYASVVLLLAWLGQGLHPTYLASTALLLTLYFGALLFAGDLYFAVLFQYLPLAVGRLLSAASALTLLPAAQGALVGVPVALVLAVPPVLAVHVSKLKRSILIFVKKHLI